MGLILACGALAFAPRAAAQEKSDPHRPACTSDRCKKVKAFVKSRYCAASPWGNGPDDGCLLRDSRRVAPGIKITADYMCGWQGNERKCEQHGDPSAQIRDVVTGEMQRVGFPPGETKGIGFTVWQLPVGNGSLVMGHYDLKVNDEVNLCAVIMLIDAKARMHVLREVPYQKVDADVPDVTTWYPLDVVDVDGDGHLEIVLAGEAYENHWIEVDTLENGVPRTIFSGLGYYL
jgi:hypothetical protein